jgi:hypothetical protein
VGDVHELDMYCYMCITTLLLIIIITGYCNGKRRERMSGVLTEFWKVNSEDITSALWRISA